MSGGAARDRDPSAVPDDGDGASTFPGGTPSGNPLDPVVRPGTQGPEVHTGSAPPPSGAVAPHDAVVEPDAQGSGAGAGRDGGDRQTGQSEQPAAAVDGQDAPAQDGADARGRAVPPPHPGAESTDPEPGESPGLDSGGSTGAGDTPPASGGTHTSLARNEKLPGGRTRLVVPLSILAVLALAFVAFFLGQLLGLF